MTFHRTRCAHCKKRLEQERPSQIVHVECVEAWMEAQAAKREREAEKKARMAARVERAETRRRKEASKTAGQRRAEVQREMNHWIVHVRDKDQPCISCGCTHARWNAGHYRSRGSAVHLSLEPSNLAKQCVRCNLDLHGNLIEYRKGLIARHGVQFVESLESDQTPRHYTNDDYDRMKAEYRALNKHAKKGQA